MPFIRDMFMNSLLLVYISYQCTQLCSTHIEYTSLFTDRVTSPDACSVDLVFYKRKLTLELCMIDG